MATSSDSIIGTSLRGYTQDTSLNTYGEGLYNTLMGFNHRQRGEFVPLNRDHQGLVFLTRPQFNLSTPNISNCGEFGELATDDEWSVERFVRCTLDPRCGTNLYEHPIHSKLMNNRQAFIPVITNRIKTLSGVPDSQSQSHTVKQGLMGEEYAIVDSAPNNFAAYDVTMTCENLKGNVIYKLFRYWHLYPQFVKINKLNKYDDYVMAFRRDYDTRIYRLILDTSYNKVVDIWCSGVAYPTNSPDGQYFDYNKEDVFNTANLEQSFTFKCMGSFSTRALLMQEFNEAQICFNPEMEEDLLHAGGSTLVRIPREFLGLFNNHGYPRINLDTRVLEWYIEADIYQEITGGFSE